MGEWLDDETDAAINKNMIDNESVPARFDPIQKLYESSGNLTKTTAMAALNSGKGIVNHDGHGNVTIISIGPDAARDRRLRGPDQRAALHGLLHPGVRSGRLRRRDGLPGPVVRGVAERRRLLRGQFPLRLVLARAPPATAPAISIDRAVLQVDLRPRLHQPRRDPRRRQGAADILLGRRRHRPVGPVLAEPAGRSRDPGLAGHAEDPVGVSSCRDRDRQPGDFTVSAASGGSPARRGARLPVEGQRPLPGRPRPRPAAASPSRSRRRTPALCW